MINHLERQPLIFSGMCEVDDFDQPHGGQITPISHLCICSVRVSILKRSG